MSRKPPHFQEFPESLRCEYGPYMAVVEHIVDGDTFDATWDVGGNVFPYRTCRLLARSNTGTLIGIDAPETNRRETREAGLAAKRWLAEHLQIGTPVRITTQPDPDSFGRYLSHVESMTILDVGASLMNAGHAVPWSRSRL